MAKIIIYKSNGLDEYTFARTPPPGTVVDIIDLTPSTEQPCSCPMAEGLPHIHRKVT